MPFVLICQKQWTRCLLFSFPFLTPWNLEENLVKDHEDDKRKRLKHKEEGEKRRQADQKDRDSILMELEKHTHSLTDNEPTLYNIVNGQVATSSIKVQHALETGAAQSTDFAASLLSGFHTTISKKISNMIRSDSDHSSFYTCDNRV